MSALACLVLVCVSQAGLLVALSASAASERRNLLVELRHACNILATPSPAAAVALERAQSSEPTPPVAHAAGATPVSETAGPSSDW